LPLASVHGHDGHEEGGGVAGGVELVSSSIFFSVDLGGRRPRLKPDQ